jgi:iron transport multicopper oxidase
VKGTATNIAPQRRTYNWNIGWVNASPDGFARPFVGINGVWPLPAIVANIGDTIVINAVNALGNETTSIHFHGLFNVNSTFEDGSAMVAQCPIGPGGTFVYEFTFTQSGTYWYHAHVGGQYIDGFRGPVTIRDTNQLNNYGTIPAANEVILTLTDVYHVEAPYLINYFLSANNTSGAEPVPDSALINEGQNAKFTMVPGKTYLFHIVNMGAIAGQYLQFDQHNMTIIEADGVYTQPYTVSQLFVAVAQRYSVLVTAQNSASSNFAVVSQFLTDMFDESITPAGQNPTVSFFLLRWRLGRVLIDIVHCLSCVQLRCVTTSSFHTHSSTLVRHRFSSL